MVLFKPRFAVVETVEINQDKLLDASEEEVSEIGDLELAELDGRKNVLVSGTEHSVLVSPSGKVLVPELYGIPLNVVGLDRGGFVVFPSSEYSERPWETLFYISPKGESEPLEEIRVDAAPIRPFMAKDSHDKVYVQDCDSEDPHIIVVDPSLEVRALEIDKKCKAYLEEFEYCLDSPSSVHLSAAYQWGKLVVGIQSHVVVFDVERALEGSGTVRCKEINVGKNMAEQVVSFSGKLVMLGDSREGILIATFDSLENLLAFKPSIKVAHTRGVWLDYTSTVSTYSRGIIVNAMMEVPNDVNKEVVLSVVNGSAFLFDPPRTTLASGRDWTVVFAEECSQDDEDIKKVHFSIPT